MAGRDKGQRERTADRFRHADTVMQQTAAGTDACVWIVGTYVAVRAVDALLRTWDDDAGKPAP
jgi:hypothetical protein